MSPQWGTGASCGLDDQFRHGRAACVGDTLAVYGNGTSPVWNGVLEYVQWEADGAGFELVLSESGVGPSDHTSFYLEDIPCAALLHGPARGLPQTFTDTADKLNYAGMVRDR